MPSEEFITLRASLDELNTTVRENTAEQQRSRVAQAEQAVEFSTWQKTMCWPHDDDIKGLESGRREQDKAINRAAGKSAGFAAAIVLTLQTLGAIFAYLRISGG